MGEIDPRALKIAVHIFERDHGPGTWQGAPHSLAHKYLQAATTAVIEIEKAGMTIVINP